MAIELSTAGIKVLYAAETTAGTFPTTGWHQIHGVKEIPSFGDSINVHQTTPLEATKNHTYIPGLSDGNGGTISLTANEYKTFHDDWDTMVAAFETAKAGGKAFYIQFYIPGLVIDSLGTSGTGKNGSYYIPVEPVALGFGGASVDAVAENTGVLVVVGQGEWKESKVS